MQDITGNIWKFGDHVNTDVIHPPDWFSLDPVKVKQGLFRRFDPTLQERLQPNDILVGGRNFGCGSSRETSIRSLKLNEIGAIVAIDFARIFFRNATNNGLPCLTLRDPADIDRIEPGMRATLDFASWDLVLGNTARLPLGPVPDFIRHIWDAGGLLATLRPAA